MFLSSLTLGNAFLHSAIVPSGARPPHYRGFTITLGRTSLVAWPALRRDLYLTMHNTHKRQTFVPPCRIRTRNPSNKGAANPRLKPRGNWDRQFGYVVRSLW